MFLNNDTQVQAGWLSGLVETFSQHDRVAAVGPKVLFPNGRLQDAGVVINTDCTSSLVGVFDDPHLPVQLSPRGGLRVGRLSDGRDRTFRASADSTIDSRPAYCEDVDLCLRLRQVGLRIVYQPAAVIVHHLSATSQDLERIVQDGGIVTAISRSSRSVTRHRSTTSIRRASSLFICRSFIPSPKTTSGGARALPSGGTSPGRGRISADIISRVCPADLGFYDLRLGETTSSRSAWPSATACTASASTTTGSAEGVCSSGRWNGLLEDGHGFPFCLCWANENWTRRWDGKDHEVLMAQSYREEDEVAVIDDLSDTCGIPSYIRINGRPLLLIYKPAVFPTFGERSTCGAHTADASESGTFTSPWSRRIGILLHRSGLSPAEWGFDAIVEFPPHQGGWYPIDAPGIDSEYRGHVYAYDRTAVHYMTRPLPGHRLFRTVMPGWDNTARRPKDSVIFAGSTPGAYQAWLECVLRQTREQHVGDEQLVFVNAWNEWAESAYLEPDLGWGHGYLEATRDARINVRLRLRPE